MNQPARLWDAETAQEIRIFKGHNSGVTRAVFSPDGRRILLAGQSCTLIDAASGQVFLTRIQFPDSWATLDAKDNILSYGPNAWKYLHGVTTHADGHAEIVNPRRFYSA